MAKPKTSSSLDIAAIIKKKLKKKVALSKLTTADLHNIANVVIFEMRGMITKGLSPIQGKGRFKRYKNTDNYPKNVQHKYPSKKNRPVNLFLSGNFLISGLKARVKRGGSPQIEVGFFDKLNSAKEKGHRTGANGQPKRPIIPKGRERYAVRIVRAFSKRLFQILDKRL